ncbi:hypothetical protein SAMN05192565_10621 [Methylobacterium gossipiicola]|uniref:Uncharacterized protein n=1 Tax=Methylobacterium gossipiicola TaxID=582675 RepID=A0A1I2SZY0_9HYPH|nr:hypothetical protein SAMN05192565_10621 [Methylobacterium gossipiicola]
MAFKVRRAVVMAAIDRVETALGGIPFFEVRVRRSGLLTPAGDAFRRMGPKLIRAWEALLPQGTDAASDGRKDRADTRGGAVAPVVRGSATIADLVAAVGRQGRSLEKIVALAEASRPDARADGTAPAGTKAAEAMKVVLAVLKEAGASGIASGDLAAALEGAGIKSGTAETAKAVLRGAGLAQCEGRRWYAAEL